MRLLARWRGKRELKGAFIRDLSDLVILAFFDELDGEYEARVRELEVSYLKRGLTQRELDKLRKNLGPVAISG